MRTRGYWLALALAAGACTSDSGDSSDSKGPQGAVRGVVYAVSKGGAPNERLAQARVSTADGKSVTTDADGSTVNVYNARSYKGMAVDPLYDPNRATYAQVVNWNADGSPDFGVPTGSDMPMTLVSRHSGKCVDVQNPNLNNGANVGQYTCNGGNWQRWHLIDLGTGYYEIQSVNSGKVLDVSGGSTADGGNVIQYDWHGGANQQWQKVTTTAPWFRLVNRASGKVLDVENCGTADGVNVRQWTWLNNNCQQWQLVP